MRAMRLLFGLVLCAAVATLLVTTAAAQGTPDDYKRASTLRQKYEAAAAGIAEPGIWIAKTPRLWYRRSVKGGHQFVVADAERRERRPAFDHERLAATLNTATGRAYTPVTLPFNTLAFVDDEKALEVRFDGGTWKCSLADYTCSRTELVGDFERRQAQPRCSPPSPEDKPRISPDKKWEAFILNYNVAVREIATRTRVRLSMDGSEGDCYDLASLAWSPDSTKIAAYRVRPGYRRLVHYVESSPEDQLQPKSSSRIYAKPGDELDLERPVLFHLATRQQVNVETSLVPNPYDMSRLEWRKDGSAVTFEYNQRGHQVYRVVEVNAATGAARAVISEEPKTFFYYTEASSPNAGKKYRYDLADGKEVLWMSERDGWNHLYLYDGPTGAVKHQVTRGAWPVRSVLRVDEAKRQVYFSASGMYPAQDPYFVNYYRIDLDGSHLTRLTSAEANHTVTVSTDGGYYVDTWSRVDQAPASEIRKTADGSLVMELERGDLAELRKAGWQPPEVFAAKGRDGTTDIWGVIYRPTTFDPARTYPVIENIYAGPHSSFVPKSFSSFSAMQAQAELGFIVVQIDGMGTSNRSKAFQDVAWKNIKDAGFPDRILWHKAVAKRYPSYDINRVGIYGTSAGGQNALGALLFHPDFYKTAVSSVGCHDNRMDKIWWNELWMSWPLGPHYGDSSNVEHAGRLKGKLLLVVGELDTNVDPSSTLQVVNALIKANKTFDLLVIPGAGHGSGGAYGDRKRYDFFVQHLLGVTPPAWNETEETGQKK